MRREFPFLCRFENNWVTKEMVKAILVERRRNLARGSSVKKPIDVDAGNSDDAPLPPPSPPAPVAAGGGKTTTRSTTRSGKKKLSPRPKANPTIAVMTGTVAAVISDSGSDLEPVTEEAAVGELLAAGTKLTDWMEIPTHRKALKPAADSAAGLPPSLSDLRTDAMADLEQIARKIAKEEGKKWRVVLQELIDADDEVVADSQPEDNSLLSDVNASSPMDVDSIYGGHSDEIASADDAPAATTSKGKGQAARTVANPNTRKSKGKGRQVAPATAPATAPAAEASAPAAPGKRPNVRYAKSKDLDIDPEAGSQLPEDCASPPRKRHHGRKTKSKAPTVDDAAAMELLKPAVATRSRSRSVSAATATNSRSSSRAGGASRPASRVGLAAAGSQSVA